MSQRKFQRVNVCVCCVEVWGKIVAATSDYANDATTALMKFMGSRPRPLLLIPPSTPDGKWSWTLKRFSGRPHNAIFFHSVVHLSEWPFKVNSSGISHNSRHNFPAAARRVLLLLELIGRKAWLLFKCHQLEINLSSPLALYCFVLSSFTVVPCRSLALISVPRASARTGWTCSGWVFTFLRVDVANFWVKSAV